VGCLGLEAFPVFLGITAGLLLERWKNHRAARREEQGYLEGFARDLQRIRHNVLEDIEALDRWLKGAKEALESQDTAGLLRQLQSLRTSEVAFPTYVLALNTGGFRVIRSFVLRDRLVEVALTLEWITQMDRIVTSFYLQHVVPLLLMGDQVEPFRVRRVMEGYHSLVMQQRDIKREALLEMESLLPLLPTSSRNAGLG